MFPLLLMPMLIGAGLGAITSRKNPLQGALLGGALGAGGGLLNGAIGAGTAASGAAGADALTHFGLAQSAGAPISMEEAALMASKMNPANAAMPNGLLGGLSDAAGSVKPFMQAAQPVMQAASMFQKKESPMPIQASPIMHPAGPNMAMNNLMQSIYGDQQQQQMMEQQKRELRKKMIGGGYGGLIG